MQSLKDLALIVCKKKPTLKCFSNEEISRLFPLKNMCDHQTYQSDEVSPQSDRKKEFPLKTISHSCDLEIMSVSLKVL